MPDEDVATLMAKLQAAQAASPSEAKKKVPQTHRAQTKIPIIARFLSPNYHATGSPNSLICRAN